MWFSKNGLKLLSLAVKLPEWIKKNLPEMIKKLDHIVIKPSVAYPCTLSEVFELFLDENAIKHLTAKTTKYVDKLQNKA